MINKQNLWFLTLFSLILVLSVYYITMPSELLLTNNSNYATDTENNNKEENENTPTIKIEESEILTSLRVEADEQMSLELEDLRLILTDVNASSEDKNNAYEKIKDINMNRSNEEKIENKIKEEFNKKAFVKIDNNQIRIVIASSEHDTELANNIMRSVQSDFDTKMYISVKFQS